MKCAYRGCGKSRKTHPGLKIYTFPGKDEQRCKQWIINSGNSLDIPLAKYEQRGLCHYHFIQEDFVNATKHRLIQMAIPLHYDDPSGEARRKEREREFNKTSGDNITSSLDKETEKDENSKIISLKEDLFFEDDYKLRVPSELELPGEKKVCYVRNLSVTKQKFKWLEDVLRKKTLNKDKKVSYYINVDDLLESLDTSDSSNVQFSWHDRENKSQKVRCYSRKNSMGITSGNKDGNYKKCMSNANEVLSLQESQSQVSNHQTQDNIEKIYIKSDGSCSSNMPDTNMWKWEEENKDDKKDVLLSSEYEFMNQDIKDEGISECHLRWSEEEDDKSCIKVLDLSDLKMENHRQENSNYIVNKNVCRSKISNKKFKHKQLMMRKCTETEKFMYIINRKRVYIRKLQNKLRKCYKKLRTLQKRKDHQLQRKKFQHKDRQSYSKIVYEPKL